MGALNLRKESTGGFIAGKKERVEGGEGGTGRGGDEEPIDENVASVGSIKLQSTHDEDPVENAGSPSRFPLSSPSPSRLVELWLE